MGLRRGSGGANLIPPPAAVIFASMPSPRKFSANIEKLQPSATIAVSTLSKQLKAEGRDIVDLSAGEPDFDTPEWIARAGVEGIERGRTRYTPAAGMVDLRQAIAARLSERAGREVAWGEVVVTAGAKQSLFNACFSLFGPGDEVLVASPYWTSYPEIVTLARAEPVFVSGPGERDFKLGPDELEAARTERTRGLILCSPCNPTGAVYDLDELRGVAEWARDHDVWLVSDEIYRRIYYGDDESEAPGMLELGEQSTGPFVLVDGASKCFAMTGWRIGFSLSPPEVAAKMTALQSHTTSNAATPSQAAALAAYGQPERAEESVVGMVTAFRRRRDRVVELMEELFPGVSYVTPGGAFYLFFRVDELLPAERIDSAAFCTWALEETGVALVPGVAFGDDRYARMSYATSDELLEEALRRLAEGVAARR